MYWPGPGVAKEGITKVVTLTRATRKELLVLELLLGEGNDPRNARVLDG